MIPPVFGCLLRTVFGATFLPLAARAYRVLTAARAYRVLTAARAHRVLTAARAYRVLTATRSWVSFPMSFCGADQREVRRARKLAPLFSF